MIRINIGDIVCLKSNPNIIGYVESIETNKYNGYVIRWLNWKNIFLSTFPAYELNKLQ